MAAPMRENRQSSISETIGEKSIKDSQRADSEEVRSLEFIQTGTKLPKEGEENTKGS